MPQLDYFSTITKKTVLFKINFINHQNIRKMHRWGGNFCKFGKLTKITNSRSFAYYQYTLKSRKRAIKKKKY